MQKVGTNGVQEKAQCCKNSSLEIVWEIQPEKEVKNGLNIFQNVLLKMKK